VFVYNTNTASFESRDVSYGSNWFGVSGSANVPEDSTKAIHIMWDGSRAHVLDETLANGDLRPA
jgi:hypothetical protein